MSFVRLGAEVMRGEKRQSLEEYCIYKANII